ncbi:hypothetical protein [Tropicimonas isoalkanivorans]|uniref:Uncharacterized protein n=1 Tax=Tropicimonas isoalkanivorans TaxID=441112 RepID=A0A1I1N5R6_9RHOB|nr:hypothetical protein [Tropicimonas isoalkanivorans]SFC92676.1 hypothetical protein SAMN04488094_111133 [Tropicimonas isoalkanivorans]
MIWKGRHLEDTGRTGPFGGLAAEDIVALVLSALWLFGAGVFFMVLPRPAGAEVPGFDPALFLMTLFAVFMPVALIWVATTAAKNAKLMREESSHLQESVDAMRAAYMNQTGARPDGIRPPLEQKLDEIARAQKKTEAALAHLTSVNARMTAQANETAALRPALRGPKPAAAARTEQPSLALDTETQDATAPLSSEDFVKALDFPEDVRDRDGFRALRLALKDPMAGALVRSAQDLLTLLAEDGIYMDDLEPDRARPEIWRKFAAGERGRAIAPLGGIRDRSSLALTAGRMRQDTVFRDCAHHFLRRFDSTFATFEKEASDADIITFADTRSARAFMLIGRVSGTFD